MCHHHVTTQLWVSVKAAEMQNADGWTWLPAVAMFTKWWLPGVAHRHGFADLRVKNRSGFNRGLSPVSGTWREGQFERLGLPTAASDTWRNRREVGEVFKLD